MTGVTVNAEDETLRSISTGLSAARKGRGLTQSEFADLLGFSRDFVSDLEQGRGTQHLRRLIRALHALGLDLKVEPRR